MSSIVRPTILELSKNYSAILWNAKACREGLARVNGLAHRLLYLTT